MLRTPIIEMVVSLLTIGAGTFIWMSINVTNSGVNLPVGAALVVAGLMVLLSAIDSIHTYIRR